MAEPATDYTLTPQQAEFLAGVCMLPAAERLQAIRRWRKRNGYLATLRLFAQFIGAANAIVANNRIAIEDIMIEAGIAHPCRTVGFNQPTIPGAAAGAILSAMVDQAKTCAGCAYRLGTPANTSPVTTEDARHCLEENETFFCHETLDEDGKPTRICRGHAQAAIREKIDG